MLLACQPVQIRFEQLKIKNFHMSTVERKLIKKIKKGKKNIVKLI